MIKIVEKNTGDSLESAVLKILQRVEYDLSHSGNDIANTLEYETKTHIANKYPGSEHFNPDKVVINEITQNSGQINVDIPGISRAYHDIDIKPINRNYITIPFLNAAGKKASDFSNTFVVTKKNGKKFIAQKTPVGIAFLFYLSKHVHQQQDETLMPDNDYLVEKIMDIVLA